MNVCSWRDANGVSRRHDSSAAIRGADAAEGFANVRLYPTGIRRCGTTGYRFVPWNAWRTGATCLEHEKAGALGAGSCIAHGIRSASAGLYRQHAGCSLRAYPKCPRCALGDGGSRQGRVERRRRDRGCAAYSRFHGDAAAGNVCTSRWRALPADAHGPAGAGGWVERGALALAGGRVAEPAPSLRSACAGQSAMVARIAARAQPPAGLLDRRTGWRPR